VNIPYNNVALIGNFRDIYYCKAEKLMHHNSLLSLLVPPVLYILVFVSTTLTQREAVPDAFSTLIAGFCATAFAQPSKMYPTVLPHTTLATKLCGGENKPRTRVFT
jgi:hypothetical protein